MAKSLSALILIVVVTTAFVSKQWTPVHCETTYGEFGLAHQIHRVPGSTAWQHHAECTGCLTQGMRLRSSDKSSE